MQAVQPAKSKRRKIHLPRSCGTTMPLPSRMVIEDAPPVVAFDGDSLFSVGARPRPPLLVVSEKGEDGAVLEAGSRGGGMILAHAGKGEGASSAAFVCAACGFGVEGDAYCTEGNVFHPEHAVANVMGAGDAFENKDLSQTAARCCGCDELVHTALSVNRDGQKWHTACFKTFEGLHHKYLEHLSRPSSVVSPTVSLPSLTRSSLCSTRGGSSTPDYVSFYSLENPAAGAARLSLEEFCAEVYRNSACPPLLALAENDSGSTSAVVTTLLWHKETTGVRHEFLLAQVCQLGRNDVWLRLERGAKRNGSVLRKAQLASSMSRPADDSVMISSLKENLIRYEKSNVDAKLAFKDTLTLLDLAKLLSIFTEECPKYNLLGQNCYYFCSVIADMLQQRFKAGLEGHIKYKNMSSNIRLRIRQRWMRATG